MQELFQHCSFTINAHFKLFEKIVEMSNVENILYYTFNRHEKNYHYEKLLIKTLYIRNEVFSWQNRRNIMHLG